LQQSNFVERLQAILAAHPHIKPSYLELEILETSALNDMAQVSKVIDACKHIGIAFALDDFGTGYSSLTYLKRLRVAQLKIDQSFVRDMLQDPDDLAILQGVIGLAEAFKREVIAEGVETVEHGTALLELGCELAQGYSIARPMPAEQLPGWAAAWATGPNPFAYAA
jgi:EAL domain-containing protein (putative c-di-GMP-specific phosphodiesterase class I)